MTVVYDRAAAAVGPKDHKNLRCEDQGTGTRRPEPELEDQESRTR